MLRFGKAKEQRKSHYFPKSNFRVVRVVSPRRLCLIKKLMFHVHFFEKYEYVPRWIEFVASRGRKVI